MITFMLLLLGAVLLARHPTFLIALAILGAIGALLGGCEKYKTAQLPSCTSHCSFEDGGDHVTGSQQP